MYTLTLYRFRSLFRRDPIVSDDGDARLCRRDQIVRLPANRYGVSEAVCIHHYLNLYEGGKDVDVWGMDL